MIASSVTNSNVSTYATATMKKTKVMTVTTKKSAKGGTAAISGTGSKSSAMIISLRKAAIVSLVNMMTFGAK